MKSECYQLFDRGLSPRQVQSALGISRASAYRHHKEYVEGVPVRSPLSVPKATDSGAKADLTWIRQWLKNAVVDPPDPRIGSLQNAFIQSWLSAIALETDQ